jgi:hypothetical protein
MCLQARHQSVDQADHGRTTARSHQSNMQVHKNWAVSTQIHEFDVRKKLQRRWAHVYKRFQETQLLQHSCYEKSGDRHSATKGCSSK